MPVYRVELTSAFEPLVRLRMVLWVILMVAEDAALSYMPLQVPDDVLLLWFRLATVLLSTVTAAAIVLSSSMPLMPVVRAVEKLRTRMLLLMPEAPALPTMFF